MTPDYYAGFDYVEWCNWRCWCSNNINWAASAVQRLLDRVSNQYNRIQKLETDLKSEAAERQNRCTSLGEHANDLERRMQELEALKGKGEQSRDNFSSKLKEEITQMIKKERAETDDKLQKMKEELAQLSWANQALINENERLRANQAQPVMFSMPTLLLRCDHLVCIRHQESGCYMDIWKTRLSVKLRSKSNQRHLEGQ
jgi:chromosome segregation ATPase